MNRKVAEEIVITWEMFNGKPSDPVKELLLRQFAQYDDNNLLKALSKCRAECKGRITPADVIQRIDDGRPGIEEAWAVVDRARRDQNATVVWTDEMAQAFGVVEKMSDDVAARMSFKDTYKRLCDASRASGMSVKWTPSLGAYDGRSGPLLEAVRLGRLTAGRARKLVPELPPMKGEKLLPEHEEPEYLDPGKVAKLVSQITDGKGI